MAMSGALGPLVLAGSGEYTPEMDLVDQYLLGVCKGRPILLIATSCAQEGLDVMTKWEQMGVAHFRRFGVEATPLRICDRDDADKAEFAERIAEAGIIWFSGGSPAYLAQSFDGTRCFQALEAANRAGAAVAGASGGLGVLNVHVPGLQDSGPTGLGLAAPVRAIAHFDRAEVRRPEFVQRIVSSLPEGNIAVGVDEDTALVWTDDQWRVMGHKRVVVYQPGSERLLFRHGDRVDVVPPPLRAAATAA